MNSGCNSLVKTSSSTVWWQRWRFGVAVTRWSWSTQLLYIEPGWYWDGWLPLGSWTVSLRNQLPRPTQAGLSWLIRDVERRDARGKIVPTVAVPTKHDPKSRMYLFTEGGSSVIQQTPWVGAMSTGDGYGHRQGRKRRVLRSSSPFTWTAGILT